MSEGQSSACSFVFFFQAEDGIRDLTVTGVQTCALPISSATPLSTANTTLAGVLFSLAYLKTRGLWLPIGLHWAWNFTMGPILSLPVSGMRFGPTLLRSQLTGAKWLTGGAYGPEGGAVTTVVCVAAIFWLARTQRFAPSPAMEEALK